jgi:phosphatidylserine/phosphatidylglycerophosphate/cardiolipin synthase-like enzyme
MPSPELLEVSVSEADIRVYFSPEHRPERRIEEVLDTAENPLGIEVYAFTSTRLARALADAYRRIGNVRVLMDAGQYHAWKAQRRVFRFLEEEGVPIALDLEASLNHNKVLTEKGRRVVTGSYNWTKAAKTQVENIVVITSPLVADFYWEHFETRWARNRRAHRAVEA